MLHAGSFVTPVLSNNLHEVHGYNRLASMARGEVIIVIQDDDMPPDSCTWLGYMLKEFARFPLLGAVGAPAPTAALVPPALLCAQRAR